MDRRIKDAINAWISVLEDPGRELTKQIRNSPEAFVDLFIHDVSRHLYDDMRRVKMIIAPPFTLDREFSGLDKKEQASWNNYASSIPAKLILLGLRIRQSGEFYRSCIITDEEIERLAVFDLTRQHNHPAAASVRLPDGGKSYFRELNYLIPPQLKKIGFEITRPGEEPLVSAGLIKKLARAIHSGYLQEMRNRDTSNNMPGYQGDPVGQHLVDFEDLPEDIKYSNIDNAYHIATKLLSIGYSIKPVGEGYDAATLHLSESDTETMARMEHTRWSWDKRLNGWIYSTIKNNQQKTHPGLIPYDDLSEAEKEKDRELVRLIPALLKDIGYIACPVSPGRISNLPYAIRPQSSIHKLLSETRKLNEEIRMMISSNPVLEEKVNTISRKIEETISEVRGSYKYARHIQKTYLPEDLYIRECFPDSFVLFRPKDIVSGDFYFFSMIKDLRIFAVADCTGHGIPGALLSTLGYGITDQAVNEIRLTDPAMILEHLFSRVHKFLRRDDELNQLHDDMDIAVCTLDLKTKILSYSGVSCPLYLIRGNELVEFKPSGFISGEMTCRAFTSERIKVQNGDTFYLFSDGYADQFGGKLHKKFQKPRFRSLLLEIHKLPMPEQRDMLNGEIEKWMNENDEDQTDDILVTGIRI